MILIPLQLISKLANIHFPTRIMHEQTVLGSEGERGKGKERERGWERGKRGKEEEDRGEIKDCEQNDRCIKALSSFFSHFLHEGVR